MCSVVTEIIQHQSDIGGLYQLALDEPISKYDLLCLAREAYGVDVDISKNENFEIKPTLNGTKLAAKLALKVPSWKYMMEELAAEKDIYNTL